MNCPRCNAADKHIQVKCDFDGFRIVRWFFCKICGTNF